MDPKFSNNGKKHRDKKHQRGERITTDLLDDEQLLMQNQHNFGRFPGESLSTSSDQLNTNNTNSNKKKWKCMQCTYENWPSALKCTLCLNSKTSSQTTYNNTTTSSSNMSPTTTTTTTTTGQHVKSNRNSLKKINSLNSLKNNYNIFESTNNISNNSNSRKNSNLNQIEITSLSHNQDSSCEEMTSVDANIGERPAK